MRLVEKEMLARLQRNPANIRNICIMAHVDHGKTTLADSLVASNGIISQRLAGKLRYLDSRKDEQERGITMKSSSIALHHLMGNDEYLINLIDSPGHVDFSSEVSTAVRLCDGAMIVVDVVEGVCAQTIVALRQAWQENLKPVLILNKIDRLILELKYLPLDAYIHLTQVLEKVNAVMAELLTSEVMEKEYSDKTTKSEDKKSTEEGAEATEYYDWSTGLDDMDDSNLYFSPDQGNVVFGSASDGWGFRVEDFAKIYSEKLGVKEAVLNKTIWGDFYLNTKLKRIMKGAQEKAKKPLFVQLVLENVWAMYDAIAVRKDKDLVEKMVLNLGLNIPARNLKQTDIKMVLQCVMSSWLPLSKGVLEMVCKKLPSPLDLSPGRVERLMFSRTKSFAVLPPESQALKTSFLSCKSSDDAPVIVFVSKMFAVESSVLPENRPKTLTAEEMAARREQARLRLAERLAKKEDEEQTESPPVDLLGGTDQIIKPEEPEKPADVFIAFARVYSGTLKSNSKLYILGPRYDPATAPELVNEEAIDPSTTLKDLKPGHHVTIAEVKHLYILMGRELEMVDEVPAGNIIGIGGLEDHILKTATISSTLACPPFTDMNLISVPILRVALEPAHTFDMGKLVQGLKLLNQADPCVQIFIQDTGEHVLVTAGEVHLERCLDDLKERFAKIDITASKPIVPFRETVVEPPKTDMVNEAIEAQQTTSNKSTYSSNSKGNDEVGAKGVITQTTSNKKSTIKIRAAPLPSEVTQLLESSVDLIKVLKDVEHLIAKSGRNAVPDDVVEQLIDFKKKLKTAFKDGGWDPSVVERIWSFGPKKCGPNVLINEVQNHQRGCVWPKEVLGYQSAFGDSMQQDINPLYAYDSNFLNGFQLATVAGPLCEEPMMGVAFIVEDWSLDDMAAIDENVDESSSLSSSSLNQPFGPFSGQIMSAVKEACRKAFQAQPQRLMVAMYSCSIQVNGEVLGKLYAVLGRRGGRILHGDLQEGSTMFEVTALLPVVESFDFAHEVRRQTSGLALPQLVFSGWEVLEIDPFWQPTTEEEYLHFGEKADTENRARKYMNGVRKRKGLRVEEKIVEFGEKQRTLTRNK